MSQARSTTANAMVGATSLCTLIAGVSIISPEMRVQIAGAIAGDPTAQLSAITSRVLDYGNLLLRVTRDYSPETTPLVGFGIVALVLTVMMFRA